MDKLEPDFKNDVYSNKCLSYYLLIEVRVNRLNIHFPKSTLAKVKQKQEYWTYN